MISSEDIFEARGGIEVDAELSRVETHRERSGIVYGRGEPREYYAFFFFIFFFFVVLI